MLDQERIKSLQALMPVFNGLYASMNASKDAFMQQFNLTRTQIDILSSIYKKPHTTSFLATEFNVSASAISQIVDQLIEKRLVDRIEDSRDRRITNITLSKNGMQLFEQINQKYLSHIENDFKTISTAEINQLTDTVRKILENVALRAESEDRS